MNRCCMCGRDGLAVEWCDLCQHFFCSHCRWNLWGREGRLLAAVREWLLAKPPGHCKHKGG
jgi:hypothetical protein